MEKLDVFMIMPFQEQFLGLYDMIKNKLGEKYNFSNAGDLDNKQNILQDIVTGIANADVKIADVIYNRVLEDRIINKAELLVGKINFEIKVNNI